MNVNVCNIKDLFGIPTAMGPNKASSWTSTPNDYNSMSDSQFLFGSQFCPENSQSSLASFEFSIQRQGKRSQQNSQDNESSILAKYQSKPQLFGGDGKEKTSLNFPTGGFKGVLEQFEENKKKIKEKLDSEVLNTFALNTKENLQRLQSSLDNFEKTLKSILDGMENLSKTMQETSQSHGLILNVLNNKNEMEQILSRMEKSLEDKDKEISDLKSSLQLLKEGLGQLTAQQNEQHLKLCEHLDHLQLPSLLAELQTFISASRLSSHIKDSASHCHTVSQQPYNSHLSVLDVLPGNQAISTVIPSEDKENVNIQQRGHILTTGPDVDNTLCTSCSIAAVPEDSHEGCQLLTPSQATPMRKVIKRDNQEKGLNTMTHIQLNQTHVNSGFMQNHADDQKKLGTNSKMQTRSVGSRKNQNENPQKCSLKKKLPSTRKKGNYSKHARVKQRITRKEGSKEVKIQSEASKHPYRDTASPDNSSWRSLIVTQPKSSVAKKSKVVFQSHENIQHALKQQGMFQTAKEVNLSMAENNDFWAHSSPEMPFSQNEWFSFSDKSPTCVTPAQKKITTCCPLFFDSDDSD